MYVYVYVHKHTHNISIELVFQQSLCIDGFPKYFVTGIFKSSTKNNHFLGINKFNFCFLNLATIKVSVENVMFARGTFHSRCTLPLRATRTWKVKPQVTLRLTFKRDSTVLLLLN